MPTRLATIVESQYACQHHLLAHLLLYLTMTSKRLLQYRAKNNSRKVLTDIPRASHRPELHTLPKNEPSLECLPELGFSGSMCQDAPFTFSGRPKSRLRACIVQTFLVECQPYFALLNVLDSHEIWIQHSCSTLEEIGRAIRALVFLVLTT